MKNITLMAFILMTVFLLSAGGCSSTSRTVAEEHPDKDSTLKSEYCKNLNPHDSDQYFDEYERCKGK